jgi:hypothetical protein
VPIMTEVHLGRLLPASLHQAIADELPQRLDFYENWLHSEGLRDGTIGLAPMSAVISFLRTEGAAYERVMTRAGRLAAEWTLASASGVRRRGVGWMPRWMRSRAAARVAGDLVRSVSNLSKVSVRVRQQVARIEVQGSVFCAVREAQPSPLCGFYVAMAEYAIQHFGLTATGRIEHCRAVSAGACVIVVDLAGVTASPEPAAAA